jgi:hypothetical protein
VNVFGLWSISCRKNTVALEPQRAKLDSHAAAISTIKHNDENLIIHFANDNVESVAIVQTQLHQLNHD